MAGIALAQWVFLAFLCWKIFMEPEIKKAKTKKREEEWRREQKKKKDEAREFELMKRMRDPEFTKIWNASKRLEKETMKGAGDE